MTRSISEATNTTVNLQDSINRYSKTVAAAYNNDCGRSRSRKSSPSNGSRSSRSRSRTRSRSPSLDSRSRSPRYYKLSYNQRVKDRDRAREREKERDRERDRNRDRDKERDRERERERLRDREKRDRTRERDRFYERKDGSRTDNNSSFHGSEKSSNSINHGLSSREKVKTEDGKRMRVGDWTEYMSSSSDKLYYYNCKTRVSQWEKPKEWIEFENLKKEDKATHSRTLDKQSVCVKTQSFTSVDAEDTRRDLDLNNVNSNTTATAKSQNDVSTNLRDPRRLNAAYESNAVNAERKKGDEMKNADSEADCNSPPNSRIEFKNSTNCKSNCSADEKSNAVSTSRSVTCNPLGITNNDTFSPSHISVKNLPKIMSQFGLTHLSTQDALKTLSQVLQLTSKVTRNNQQTISGQRSTNVNSPSMNTPLQTVRESPSSTSTHSRHHSRQSHNQHQKHNHSQSHLHSHSHYHHSSQHHQSADGIRHELDLLINRSNWGQSPNSDVSVNSSTRSPTSSITSITPGISSSIRPSLPTLTPSLANYLREDLVSHVIGWPTEQLEKQVQRYSVDAHNTGSLDATRVSAELKMARSLVRLTEIQATLQEQRILFLRQQIKDVEEWKSQNASH